MSSIASRGDGESGTGACLALSSLVGLGAESCGDCDEGSEWVHAESRNVERTTHSRRQEIWIGTWTSFAAALLPVQTIERTRRERATETIIRPAILATMQ